MKRADIIIGGIQIQDKCPGFLQMVGFKKLIHLLIEHLNKSFNVNLT
jgi:hypothetical protein